MRLTSFVVWKSWASNRLRTLLSVLGIALGVAVPVAIHVVDHDTIESRLRAAPGRFGRADFEVRPLAREDGEDPVAVRRRLAGIAGVAGVSLLQEAVATLAVEGKSTPEELVTVYGLAPLPGSAFGHYRVAEGADLENLDYARVLVAPELAADLGLRPGAKVRLERPAVAPITICRGGRREVVRAPAQRFAVEVEVKGVLAHERLARRELGRVVVAPFGLATRLARRGRPVYRIHRRPGADPDRLRRELAAEFVVLDERMALLGERADERAFRNGVKVLGCLALVLGMFVVFQTLSFSLVERLQQIGLLRCLGASRGSVASIFLLDAVLLAVLGAGFGIGLGLGLAWLLQALGFSTLGAGKDVDVFAVPWRPVLWTAALGVAFTLAGAAFPLVKARNVPPLDVLRPRGLDTEGTGAWLLRGVNGFLFVMLVVALPLGYLAMTPLVSEQGRETLVVLAQLGAMVLLFGGVLLVSPGLVRGLGGFLLRPWRGRGLAAFLVDKALRRGPGRFAAAVCGLAVVLLAMVGLESLTHALRGEALRFGATAMERRLFVRCAPVSAAEAARAVAGLEGVEAVEIFEGSVEAPFVVRGLRPEALARPGGPLAGRPELQDRYRAVRSLVVSSRLARMRGLRAGAAVALATDEGAVAYTVLAVSDAAGFFPDERVWAVAAPSWLRRDFCVDDRSVDHLGLKLAAGSSWPAVLEAVGRRLPGVTWAKWGPDIVAYHLRDIRRDFTFFEVLLALILAVAALGLVNGMTIAALGRARELGVLRALGVGRRQLRALFVLEGLLVAALAALLTLALGLPLGRVLVSGLERVAGLDAPFVPPLVPLLLVAPLALLTGGLAAIVPAARIAHLDPTEAVRYE